MNTDRVTFHAQVILHGLIARGENLSEKTIATAVKAAQEFEAALAAAGISAEAPTLRMTGSTPASIVAEIDEKRRQQEIADEKKKYDEAQKAKTAPPA